MSLVELYAHRSTLAEQMATLKVQLAQIDNAIYALNVGRIAPLYEREAKQHGTVRLLDADGIEIVGDIKKEVKWESSALMEVASNMEWKEAKQLFKITFEVPEKTYAKLDPSSEIKKKIDEARTVKYGELKISLHKQEESKTK